MATKKIIPKRRLEIKLDKLETLKTPKLGLEQYPVSAEAASEILYMAGFEHNDLDGKTIDLGTGTGRLAIGATLMGASNIVGLDVPHLFDFHRKKWETIQVDLYRITT